MSKTLKEKIVKTLIESKKIAKEDVNEALALSEQRNIGLDKALIEKGLIKEQDLLVLLVRELNIPFINLGKYRIDPSLQEVVNEKVARQYNIIPLSSLEDTMTVAMSDPFNVFAIDDLKNISGKEIDVVMSTNSEIKKAIDTYYGSEDVASVTDVSKDIQIEDFEIISDSDDIEGQDDALDESEKAPIIRMVNLIVKEAINQRASDIHIEPALENVRVRYRIDGVLHDILEVPKENQNALIVRIKIMARLDITVSHIPQDGRFKLKLGSKEVDFRVSLLPTTFGQKVVMRVLDKQNLSVGLEGLGLSDYSFKLIKEASQEPFGMILVTGPTGSGKSTTLYSILNDLNTVERNIITVEDPVEYQVEGLTQIQTYSDIGLTFSEGLRAILRQSPDIVMVGEIRDNETADIAIKAALTGQLVLSTLHTNDAAGALTRIVDMGVESFLVASSVVLVSAQRLCRKICEKCKEEVALTDKIKKDLTFEIDKSIQLYQGKGCDACRDSGYRGRTSITEVMAIDDNIRQMLLEGKSSDDIKNYAKEEKGMLTLFEDAMEKCKAGETTLEEVLRVTAAE